MATARVDTADTADEVAGLVRVGTVEELRGRCQMVVSGGRHGIAVFWHEGRAYAVDNRCPHMGFPLSRGSVRDGILTCHWHHARFDLASGGTFDPFADDVQVYPTRIVDGVVWVDPRPAARDRRAHWKARLEDGLEQNLPLVVIKAVLALLESPGPLAGWQVSAHPLTFSLSAVGFAAQTSFTLEQYRDVSLDELAASEPDDPRFWWKRRSA